MNPVPFILLAISLPLLLGGCGEKESVGEVKPEEPVAETKPKPEGVKKEELEFREGVVYLKGSDTPYTGKAFALYENGQKRAEENFKDGKPDGLQIYWHENGQKDGEGNFKDGKMDGSWVYWYENGQKDGEGTYKDGKGDGLWTEWHENGQKSYEETYKDGKLVEGSEKWWNSKGEPVDSEKEAHAE